MKDADDLLAFAAPQRHPGMRALQRRVHDLLGGQIDVDRVHRGPVHHDVRDGELAKIEHAAEHVAVELHHAAFLVVQVDGASDFLVRREHVDIVADIGAEQPQSVAHQELHGGSYRCEHLDHEIDERRDRKRHAVGVDDGVSLGQHLGEQHHQHCHHRRGVGDADLAEQRQQQTGGQCRSGDVGEVVHEQNGADQSFPRCQQTGDDARTRCCRLRRALCMRARDAAVSAVSEPEKKAEAISKPRIAPSVMPKPMIIGGCTPAQGTRSKPPWARRAPHRPVQCRAPARARACRPSPSCPGP